MARWLPSVIAMLVLATSGLRSYASAGVTTDATCCCPSPDVCQCHEHPPQPTDRLQRCGGAVHVDAPVLVAAVPLAPDEAEVPERVAIVVMRAPSIPHEDIVTPPEKPPF